MAILYPQCVSSPCDASCSSVTYVCSSTQVQTVTDAQLVERAAAAEASSSSGSSSSGSDSDSAFGPCMGGKRKAKAKSKPKAKAGCRVI